MLVHFLISLDSDADISGYCQYMSQANRGTSGPQTTVETIGKSTEGRDILLVKISNGGGGTKPAIWLDGGMHARE